MDEKGVLKLADFGASKLLLTTLSIVTMEVCKPYQHVTPASRQVPALGQDAMHGTANYMAPEVIKQTQKYDEKESCLACECLCVKRKPNPNPMRETEIWTRMRRP